MIFILIAELEHEEKEQQDFYPRSPCGERHIVPYVLL